MNGQTAKYLHNLQNSVSQLQPVQFGSFIMLTDSDVDPHLKMNVFHVTCCQFFYRSLQLCIKREAIYTPQPNVVYNLQYCFIKAVQFAVSPLRCTVLCWQTCYSAECTTLWCSLQATPPGNCPFALKSPYKHICQIVHQLCIYSSALSIHNMADRYSDDIYQLLLHFFFLHIRLSMSP